MTNEGLEWLVYEFIASEVGDDLPGMTEQAERFVAHISDWLAAREDQVRRETAQSIADEFRAELVAMRERPMTHKDERVTLTEAEREALFRAGDHHPDQCDCTGYAEEVGYAPGHGEVCGGFEDTLAAVERIVADRLRAVEAERDELLRGSRCPECCATEWNAAAMLRADLAAERAKHESRGYEVRSTPAEDGSV